MKLQTLRLRATAVTVLLAFAALAAGCGPKPPVAGELAQDKDILKTCAKATKLASKVDLDVSGSTRTEDLNPERAAVVEAVARRTAICGGHLRVTLFSATSAATAALYDDELVLPGATDNARLRRVQKLVDDVTAKVSAAYRAGAQKLSPGASDIIGQYRLAAEYRAQLGSGYQLELTVLTDGVQTAGLVVGQTSLTPARARTLAAKVTVPKLPGASVVISGLGKVANGKPVASTVVESLAVFYDALCAKTGAAKCASVTDYATAGR